jgi:acylphosphatase
LDNRNITDVINHFKIPRHIIRRILKENNIDIKSISISKRKYKLNENLLDNIDCPEKAILLGLFFADGCNHSDGKTSSIGLASEDVNYLDKFNKMIFDNRPLSYYKSKRKNEQDLLKIQIRNKHFWNNLNKYGCIPQKSITLEWPKYIPDEFICYFLRGYFDGDGSIKISRKIQKMKKEKWDYIYKLTNYQISICGSYNFLNKLKDFLYEKLNINCYMYNPKNNKIHALEIGGHKQVEKFLHYIYSDNILCLDRKYNRYLQFKEFMKSSKPKMELIDKIIKEEVIN